MTAKIIMGANKSPFLLFIMLLINKKSDDSWKIFHY